MATRWLLVADASRARLFRHVAPRAKKLELVETFDHEESRAKTRDLVADIGGRKPVGPADGHGLPGVAEPTEPKAVEAEKFARELAAKLGAARLAEPDLEVVIVAAPHFLGLLRASLDAATGKRVASWFDKDLTKLSEADVLAHLHRLGAA